MKQHDDDAAPPQWPRLRRRAGAKPPVWPFPAALTAPQSGKSDPEIDPAQAGGRPDVDPDAPPTTTHTTTYTTTHTTTHTIPQRRKP